MVEGLESTELPHDNLGHSLEAMGITKDNFFALLKGSHVEEDITASLLKNLRDSLILMWAWSENRVPPGGNRDALNLLINKIKDLGVDELVARSKDFVDPDKTVSGEIRRMSDRLKKLFPEAQEM